MARRATITDEQILEAARTVFLEEGFGAQTAKIARLAGVSEGSIFKRFRTKDELFAAALEIEFPPAWHRQVTELAGTGDVKENLITIAYYVLCFFMDTMPRIIAVLGKPTNVPQPDRLSELRRRDYEVIGTFLEQEIELGRLASCDTELLIRMVMGPLIDHSMESVFHRKSVATEERLAIARGTISILWAGIAPR